MSAKDANCHDHDKAALPKGDLQRMQGFSWNAIIVLDIEDIRNMSMKTGRWLSFEFSAYFRRVGWSRKFSPPALALSFDKRDARQNCCIEDIEWFPTCWQCLTLQLLRVGTNHRKMARNFGNVGLRSSSVITGKTVSQHVAVRRNPPCQLDDE